MPSNLAAQSSVITLPPGAPTVGPAQLYLATLSPGQSRVTAIESMRRTVRVFRLDKDWWSFPWQQLTAQETTYARAALVERYSPATATLDLSIMRGVLKQCFRLSMIDAETYQRAIMLPPVKGERAPAGRMLSEDEIRKLAGYLDRLAAKSHRGAMMKAIFAAALGGGLRREELATLTADALTADGKFLRVEGKGKRERMQPLPAWAGSAIRAWVAVRGDLQAQTLFVAMPLDQGLGLHDVYAAITKAGRAAGLEHFSPHDLRRTFASRMLDRADLATTQKLMAHKNVATTIRYDRRGDRAAAKAVDDLEGWGLESSAAPKIANHDMTLTATLGELGLRNVATATPQNSQNVGVKGDATPQSSQGDRSSQVPEEARGGAMPPKDRKNDRKNAQLVNRRVVSKPDFRRDGAALDLAWAITQAKGLREHGASSHKIVRVMTRLGISRGDGSEITVADVERWLTS